MKLIAPREKFLVLELTPRGANASFLSLDENRRLLFEKSKTNVDLKKVLKSRRKLVVAADTALATTMPVPLALLRDRMRKDEEITLDEIENLIAQAMQKVFTECRSQASKHLAIDDIDTILVAAKTSHFKVDGHAVMNPIGFTGKQVSLTLELTFTTRSVFDALNPFFNSPDIFSFMEAPQAWMLSVARIRRLPIAFIAPAGEKESFIFAFGKDGSLVRKKIAWAFGALPKQIAEGLGVTEALGDHVYHTYRRGEVSRVAERNFKKMIQPAVDKLLDELRQANVSGFVYFAVPRVMPFDLPFKNGGANFEALAVDEILTELGLQRHGSSAGREVSLREIAPFIESYFSKTDSEINQKLRRRLHWLAK